MDKILTIIENLDLISTLVGLGSAGLVYLISKLPPKIKNLVAKIIDKTDAELDKDTKK